MKKIAKILTAYLLSLAIVLQLPVRSFAETPGARYISEIRLGVGKKAAEALAALEGYEVLKDGNGDYANLNEDAGGGIGSRGQRVVYLGYKLTSNRSEAITDLAVMNMKGGYSVKDYEALMEYEMKSQIIPFVEMFIATIEEYRENYASSVPANRERARYVHDMLNKLTDDDTDNAPLGDLLLKETKYEMGDAAYNALSASEKKQHADLLTIIAQANGKAVYIMENLLTRAADPAEDTWIDRFTATTLDDMIDETGLAPTPGRNALAKLYYDDAMELAGNWDQLRDILIGAEEDEAAIDAAEVPDNAGMEAKVQALENAYTDEKVLDVLTDAIKNDNQTFSLYNKICNVAAKEYLLSVDYEDGTLYDFFTQTAEEIEEDVSVLYPLIAALSDGQKAGLEFISMRELILIGATDENGYKNMDADGFPGGSIYDGVDRGIFEPGGVALTSDAIRTKNALQTEEDTADSPLHWYNYALMGLAGASAIGSIASVSTYLATRHGISSANTLLKHLEMGNSSMEYESASATVIKRYRDIVQEALEDPYRSASTYEIEEFAKKDLADEVVKLQARTPMLKWLSTGFTVAMVIITAITVWQTFRDLKDYYKVDYSPIPHYMVDEKDIVTYNSKGEKIVLRSQEVYYKAVSCNRTSDDDFYDVFGTSGDLNGDVGKQWLALYAERNKTKEPILASSLKVVTSEEIPAGYETGIHMFGKTAAENLNNPLYVWNASAPKVYVYFQAEAGEGAGAAGTGFSGGSLALGALGGAVIGVIGTAMAMRLAKKKKEEASA